LALVVALNGGMLAVKAVRLCRLARPGALSFGAALRALLGASAINNVTPLRGGDVARLWMLERHAGVTKSDALAIAVAERLIEMLALAALALGAALLAPGQRWALIAAPLVLVGTAGLLLGLRRLRPHRLRALGGRGATARILALSLAAWMLEITMLMVCGRALGLRIGPALAPLLLLGINLALTLPSTPANAGPFESATVVVLGLAGIGPGPAAAFAILYHAAQVLPVTLVGLAVASRALAGRRSSRPPDRSSVPDPAARSPGALERRPRADYAGAARASCGGAVPPSFE
jgi:hypothetical protein